MQEGEPVVGAGSSVQDQMNVTIAINFLECIGGVDEPHSARYFQRDPPIPASVVGRTAGSRVIYQLPRKQEKRCVRQCVVNAQAVNHRCHASKRSCNLFCSK